jgi:hypothetical protein
MPAITINRVPLKVWKDIKTFAGSRSRYAQKALAAQLATDGRADLAKLLTKSGN